MPGRLTTRTALAACALALSVPLPAPAAPAQDHPPGVLSITFDDANLTQLKLGLPEAEKLKIRGTLYVPTLLVMLSTTHTDYDWLMSWSQIVQFRDAGWEIGSHSRTHYDLTKIPPSSLDWEMSGSRNDIKVNLGVTPTTFAAPYGAYNAAVMRAASKVYDGLLTTNSGVNHRGSFNPYAIDRVVIGNDVTAEQVCGQIATVAADGDWLVLAFHGIVESKPAQYYVSVPVFDQILTCADEARKAGTLKIMPVAEALQELRPAPGNGPGPRAQSGRPSD